MRARAFGDPAGSRAPRSCSRSAERPALVAGQRRLVGRRAGTAARARGDGAPAGVPERLGRGSLPPEHELFFQHARERGAGGGRRRLRRRRPARLPAPLRPAAGDEADPRSTATRASSAGTAFPTSPSSATARRRSTRSPTRCGPPGGRAGWLERLRAAELEWWDGHRAEIESDGARPPLPARRGARSRARSGHRRDRRRR